MDIILNKQFDEANNCWNVAMSGEVDIFTSDGMKKSLLALVDERPGDVRLDCKRLEYVDSTALGALVAVLKHVKANGGDVYMRGVKPNILKLFKITNLDKVFIVEGGSDE